LANAEDSSAIYKVGESRIFSPMNLITTIIEPDADGSLHLPVLWSYSGKV
jgi:hypothetical protein